jgi:DNA-binding NtrC family response regulator
MSPLADYFVANFNRLQDNDIAGVAVQAIARPMERDFPGNIREPENIIEQPFALCRGGITELHHCTPRSARPCFPQPASSAL